jgi:hypothetical protein
MTTYWSESTTLSRCLRRPALRYGSFEFIFPCSLTCTVLSGAALYIDESRGGDATFSLSERLWAHNLSFPSTAGIPWPTVAGLLSSGGAGPSGHRSVPV